MSSQNLHEKLSAGEFLFGPKKPKLTHSKSQHSQDTKRYKEKHAKSVPGKLAKGYKMVFGRKVKVEDASFVHDEWRSRFSRAFFNQEVSEELAGIPFEQALIEEGEVTEELLEDVFVGLFEAFGIDDDALVDEAIDELVEELWTERMERTKAFARKAAKATGDAAKKHGKEVAKSAGHQVVKTAAAELEKHLKGVKSKKGTAAHTLKHAARGALKQIAKNPKRAKEIAAKSVKKLAGKAAKGAIKKGLKMVFGRWAKVESLDEAKKSYPEPKSGEGVVYNQRRKLGIHHDPSGYYTAMTATRSKDFKKFGAALSWLLRIDPEGMAESINEMVALGKTSYDVPSPSSMGMMRKPSKRKVTAAEVRRVLRSQLWRLTEDKRRLYRLAQVRGSWFQVKELSEFKLSKGAQVPTGKSTFMVTAFQEGSKHWHSSPEGSLMQVVKWMNTEGSDAESAWIAAFEEKE